MTDQHGLPDGVICRPALQVEHFQARRKGLEIPGTLGHPVLLTADRRVAAGQAREGPHTAVK